MLERAISELEAYRDDLMEQAVKIDVMIQTLKNGEAPKPATRKSRYSDEVKDLILDELRQHDKPMTNHQLARSLNRGASTISTATHELLNEQRIEMVGKQGHKFLYTIKV